MQGTSHGIRQPVRMVTIDSSHDGQRIDNFLLGQLKGVPRTRVYRFATHWRGQGQQGAGQTRIPTSDRRPDTHSPGAVQCASERRHGQFP